MSEYRIPVAENLSTICAYRFPRGLQCSLEDGHKGHHRAIETSSTGITIFRAPREEEQGVVS